MYSLAMLKLSCSVLLTTFLAPICHNSKNGLVHAAQTAPPLNTSSFHMSIGMLGSKILRRDTTYITSQGYVTTDRSQATVFYITDNQLFSDSKLVSANTNDLYIPFAASSAKLAVSRVWTYDSVPIWSNTAFAGDGIATYCQGTDSRIYIVLQSPPRVCKAVEASKVPIVSASSTHSSSQISSTTVSQVSNSSTSEASSSTSEANSSTSEASSSTSVNQVSEATSIIEASKFQSFCSAYLGYTTPVTTQTQITNVTANATATATYGVVTTSADATFEQTETVPSITSTQTITPSIFYVTTTTTSVLVVTHTLPPAKPKRDHEPHKFCQACEDKKEKRIPSPSTTSANSNVTIPSALSTFPSNILSSACSLEAKSVSSTSTITITTTKDYTNFYTATVPASTETDIYTTSQTTTVSEGASIVLTTVPTPTSTVTSTFTSTSTINVPANAPSGTITWLSIDPPINAHAGFALSDPSTHMTDNYYTPTKREVFIITAAGKLYSVTNNAYYYPLGGTSGNKLFWSTNAALGSTLFYSSVNATNGETQLFLSSILNGPPFVFCVATDSSDANGATGFHIHYETLISLFPVGCRKTNLFLTPTS